MRRFWSTLCVLVVATVSLAAAELSVAVIDLERVFTESKMTLERTAQLQETFRGKEQELAAIKKEIAALEKDKVLYLPQNIEYQNITIEIEVLKHRAKLMVQQFERAAAMAQTQATADAYKMINTQVGRFAAEEKIDMVFIKPQPDVSGADPARLQLQMRSQSLFWAGPQFDITDKFLAWSNERAAPGAPAPAPSVPQIDLGGETEAGAQTP